MNQNTPKYAKDNIRNLPALHGPGRAGRLDAKQSIINAVSNWLLT